MNELEALKKKTEKQQKKIATLTDQIEKLQKVVGDSLESRMRADAKNAKDGDENEFEYIKKLVRAYYDLQQPRIMHNNRIKGMIRNEVYDADEAARFHGDLTLELLETAETHMKQRFTIFIERQPIWQDGWLPSVRGIGPVLAAGLVAELGSSANFDNVGKLWAYCGLHVKDGACVKRKKGVKSNWNSVAKTLCWKVGDSFVKSGGAYRKLYDARKEFEQMKHPESFATGNGKEVRFGKGHLDARARRYTVKMFLSNLWEVWRTVDKLPVVQPYGVEMANHGFKIDPWDFQENPDKYIAHAFDSWGVSKLSG